ncbi:MAG: heparan-alpha-glucosaminide N-acetyltransferase domain-containing protein [Haliscomenobacter sp.]|uniref:heparan-alpha-glucosaminide N-acetyltransferase domain-containing protein n=1 Tax=Haliscomenobacter sp. TaxID=2717303 RepID=UPI0029AD0224|nr:heparan-alpha-glucosaminide N-acetyltransferase domain-containing protein [Haliscomenobacter sp.]MDX2069892.1 heparan-alpha-glucosaminide N-acetyltransferase domain-containing protein [Haliscomenobacter sp.]
MSTVSPSLPVFNATPKKRIVFLDVLRAYAIMMMLQGHFVDTMLDDRYRDLTNPIYWTWHFMRGLTAPIFFFVSGAIFVFLMLRDSGPWYQNVRIQKGLRRVLLLLFLGYILKWNFLYVFSFKFFPSFFFVDVFHIIGLAIFTVIAVFILHQYTRIPLPLMYFVLALTAFLISPDVKTYDWSGLPIVLQNYFIKDHGSTFTLFPWIGFSLFGGVVGWHMNRWPNFYHTHWAPLLFISLGIWIHYSVNDILNGLHYLTTIDHFRLATYNNASFWRLGHVFIVFSIFIWITKIFKNIPPLVMKIGGETLVIYSVHYVLLYGTWFGLGVRSLGSHSWTPWSAAIGAVLFLVFFAYLIYRIEEIRYFLYHLLPHYSKLYYRFFRLKLRRFYLDKKGISSNVPAKKVR